MYIHTKFQYFRIFLKCFVYKLLIWHIQKVAIVLSEGLIETLHKIFCSIVIHEQRNHSGVKVMHEKFN